jgi:hypothetical protein
MPHRTGRIRNGSNSTPAPQLAGLPMPEVFHSMPFSMEQGMMIYVQHESMCVSRAARCRPANTTGCKTATAQAEPMTVSSRTSLESSEVSKPSEPFRLPGLRICPASAHLRAENLRLQRSQSSKGVSRAQLGRRPLSCRSHRTSYHITHVSFELMAYRHRGAGIGQFR